MKKLILILTPLTLIILIAAFSLTRASDTTETKDNTKRVGTVKAEQINFQETVFATGKLSTKEEIKLSFKTGGIIRNVQVREGQRVRKGQVLAELRLDEISAQVQQAQLGSKQAEINIKNAELGVQMAQRDYENAQGLYKDSVATFEQLDNARIQLDNAKNKLEAAKTGLQFNDQNQEIANFNLAYSKITAPSNGVILRQLAEASELVGPGTPVFLMGTNEQQQVIRVNITDKEIIHIELGDPAEVYFDAYPNYTFIGNVYQIAKIADPYTGTYEVEITVDKAGKKLFSGFIGSVEIKTRQQIPLVRIPIDALISADKNKGQVFLVRGDSAIRTPVDIHKLDQDYLLLSDGIQVGDELVIKGGGYLQNGDPIRRE